MSCVLIVDDDVSTVRMVSLLLWCERISVVQAYDGAEGLDALTAVQPDLVLLDMQMPRVDGREFYKTARQRGYTGPIVVCSATGARRAQRELGADAAVEKPFDPEDLLSEIRELLPR
jgi:CheY-like chemotaxis protein